MYLSQPLDSNLDTVNIELVGGSISIRTHSRHELILDARKLRYVGLIPHLEVNGNTGYIHKQAVTAFFPQKENVSLKVLVPENININCKLFSGEVNINGTYKKVAIKVRAGNIIAEGPYFALQEQSSFNVMAGNIELKEIDVPNLHTKVLLGEVIKR